MIAVSGAGGFLGWHTRAAIRATGRASASVKLGDGFDHARELKAVEGASRAVHIAGVNRGTDAEVSDGNIRLAEQFAGLIRSAENPPPVVVFANSEQARTRTLYGEAKRRSAEIIEQACRERDIRFDDIELPNLFGEHGRPFYNSVFATFSTMLAAGDEPYLDIDKPLTLLHAQDAADILIGDTPADTFEALTERRTVGELLAELREVAHVYGRGEIPDVSTPFRRNVFNSYRSYAIAQNTPIRLAAHADARGSFFEVIKSHGGQGQASFSTSRPAVTRGQHYHRRKIERFIVVSGQATISLRKLFSDETLVFEVGGDEPVAIDMPTMWAHKITNTGNGELLTAFWSNELFDPEHPDTFPEDV